MADHPRAYENPRSDRVASALPTEPELHAARDPYAAFRFRGYRFFAVGNLLSVIGRQMLAVAVGWEIFQRTHSATALGLVGLVQALPVILFAIPAGDLADRCPRKIILLTTQMITIFSSLGLALLSWRHDAVAAALPLRHACALLAAIAALCEKSGHAHFDSTIPLMLALLGAAGIARAFGWAARGAFFPNLVQPHALSNAVSWNSSLFQIGSVSGPALCGLLIAKLGYPVAYALDACCALAFAVLLLPINAPQKQEPAAPVNLSSLFSGMQFVWRKKIILATITLDLFAVMLGGATALLPMFADQILHCGAIGLGWLRASSSIGAFVMGILLAHLPPMRNTGRSLLLAVAGFGIATIIFGLSKSFWLSVIMLGFTGAFDTISVVVRHSLVQLLTPDEMRGRVSAVNNVFIGSSNEIGAFESGITAAIFGPVLSVVGGGIGTILSVVTVALIWPQVARLGSFDSMKPEKP